MDKLGRNSGLGSGQAADAPTRTRGKVKGVTPILRKGGKDGVDVTGAEGKGSFRASLERKKGRNGGMRNMHERIAGIRSPPG